MPELPEVETVARTLAPHVSNCQIISHALLRASSLHPQSLDLASLAGCEIRTVGRRGKLLLFDLKPPDKDGPSLLAAHLRMTGRFGVYPQSQEAGKHTRCVFGLLDANGEKKQLFFDDIRAFGQLFAATAQQLELWPFWRNLGPEPLEMGGADLKERLTGKRPVKSALLDQAVIAGIGNIYADEALFRAAISPHKPAGEVSREECGRLMKAIKAILTKAIEKRGSSIRDYRDANGNAGSFQNGFLVYGRGGEKCKKCGQTLIKEKIGGRSAVFCPNCQK